MALVIREYREGDEYGIVKLFNEVFGKEMTVEGWRWKYRGQKNEKVCSLVLADDEERIVGYYGGIPLRMVLDGREIKGVTPVDTMIHPKHRSFVRFKNIVRTWESGLIEDSFIMFYGFSPENVIKLSVDRLKIYERVGPVYEACKEVIFHNSPARFLYKLEPMSFDDQRIDKLWNSVKGNFRLAVIRDSRYLGWRYRDNPVFSYQLWGLTSRWSSTLLALAVLKNEQSETLKVMDLVFSKSILHVLISKIENVASTTGKQRLCLWLPLFDEPLKAMGFSLALSGATIPTSTHPLTLKGEEIREKFFYTMGDTDYI